MVIVSSFYFDIWGYDCYIPDKKQLQFIAISLKGLDDTDVGDEAKMGPKADFMADNRLKFMELTGETMTDAYEWLTNCIEKFTSDLDKEEKEELLSLYKEELFSLSMKDLKKDFPIGTLTLAKDGYDFGVKGYIYPRFENTIEYLKKIGIPVNKKIEDYDITQIKINYYKDNYTDLGAYVERQRSQIREAKIYESSSEIKEIQKHLIFSEYTINPLLNPIDSGRDVTVTYRNSEGKTVAQVVGVMK